MAEATTRYRAFLSYSHKDADWGRWLHKELERFRVDRDLVGRQTPLGPVPPNLRPIFADREDFASSPSLKEATSRALEASEFLVVICSPRSAKSFHVNEEIRLFKASGKSSRVFPIIVDGEPNSLEAECFPPALKRQVTASGELSEVTEEPIAADARDFADGRELAKLKIVAGLLGIGLDEIRKRAARAARKRFVVLSGVAALMGLLAI
ncbi:toll/interleukin-1 receptor domain-containing protein, partial [Bradyrhizobium ottawaense]